MIERPQTVRHRQKRLRGGWRDPGAGEACRQRSEVVQIRIAIVVHGAMDNSDRNPGNPDTGIVSIPTSCRDIFFFLIPVIPVNPGQSLGLT